MREGRGTYPLVLLTAFHMIATTLYYYNFIPSFIESEYYYLVDKIVCIGVVLCLSRIADGLTKRVLGYVSVYFISDLLLNISVYIFGYSIEASMGALIVSTATIMIILILIGGVKYEQRHKQHKEGV